MDRTTTIPERPRARVAGRSSRGLRAVALAVAALAATLTFTACPDEKGPAEKAGEKVDDGVQKLKDAVSPPGPAEKLGRKVDKATGAD